MEGKIGYNIYKIGYGALSMENKITKIDLRSEFSVTGVYTLFYMEISKDFSYGGESHDFWELVYIDKGETLCTAGQKRFVLKSGELTFHRPGEYHNLSGDGRADSNISILTFDAVSLDGSFYEGRIFRLDNEERALLSMLFEEGLSALKKEEENDPLVHTMLVREGAPFGYGHMIKNLLEIFLIKLRRNKDNLTKDSRRRYKVDGVNVPEWIKELVDHLGERVKGSVKISELCSRFGVSESFLKKEFSRYYGGGVINYFHKMKAQEAKRLIREGKKNFSEIADALGFDNSQYFTRFFKQMTKMTPTEYRKSIISRKSSCQSPTDLI